MSLECLCEKSFEGPSLIIIIIVTVDVQHKATMSARERVSAWACLNRAVHSKASLHLLKSFKAYSTIRREALRSILFSTQSVCHCRVSSSSYKHYYPSFGSINLIAWACLPDRPVRSILGRFLAFRTMTVSRSAAG